MTTYVDVPLDLAPLVEPTFEREATIEERFEAFHAANPQVAAALEHYAAQWLAAGHRKVGVKALVERLRWESGIQSSGEGGYRLNNVLTSRYARLLIQRHPEWSDAIETRQLKAA